MKAITNTSDLGRVIRTERKRLKVTQKELAMAAGTGLRFIVELERGKATCRVDGIFKVLQALGVRVLLDAPSGDDNGTDAS